MAASQSVSLRVPQRLLEHLDAIAVERFPTRKDGEPNRSRVILDFIEKGIERTVSDNTPQASQTLSGNSVEELIRQQVQFQLQIQQMVRQQLEQYSPYSPSFPAITELQQEVAEIKRILKSLVTVDNPNTVSDNSSTTSDDCDRPERQHQPTTASTQPQSATQRQSDRSGPEQSQPATASKQPEPAIQRQPGPLIDDRHQLSDNCEVISDSGLDPNVSTPGKQPPLDSLVPTDRDRFSPAADESDRTPPEQPDLASAETHAQQEFQPQSTASDRDRPSPIDESDRIPPEQHHPTTAETPAPTQSKRDRPESAESDRTPPEQPRPATADTVLQQSDKPEFPEWMTAKQAFQALGGDPGDRGSSVSSVDGLKQIKFSTFKSKTSSDLKPFGLELNQDRRRRRLPCYRLLKSVSIPSDKEILQTIQDLDRQLRTDNYLPIFHLREKLQPRLSREELDRALYRLSRNNLIELSALQEVRAYTPEQIEAGIPQNVGGRLFFIIRCDS